jgi:predicted metalloprotease with PDZ domain
MKGVALGLILGLLATATVQAAEPEHRGALGVTLSNSEAGGALLTGVYMGSPASRMGLQVGDRIVAINGKDVTGYNDVISAVTASEPGSKISLRVDRAGWWNDMSVTLGDAGQVFQAQVGRPMMTISQRVDASELERENNFLKQQLNVFRSSTEYDREAAAMQEWWSRGQHGLNGNDPALFQ